MYAVNTQSSIVEKDFLPSSDISAQNQDKYPGSRYNY